MRILLIHNYYQYAGGEDKVVKAEKKLLDSKGHSTELLQKDNSKISGFYARLKAAIETTESRESKEKAAKVIAEFQPNVVHVHNFFPLLSPSIYDACHQAGVPVVQTLHNFRTICPGALLVRKGRICEECLIGSPYRAVWYRCYRNSFLGSLAVARMVSVHKKRQTWQHKVDKFIALTEFSRRKFVEAGFASDRIAIKPNFYDLPPLDQTPSLAKGSNALFVGRMSREKGFFTLIKAWKNCQEIPLRLVGEGPLFDKISIDLPAQITYLGPLSRKQVAVEMEQASFLVMSSEWYETFGMVIIEAFAHGLPVVASRLGAMTEIVEDGRTGLHFEAGNPKDLARKVRWMYAHPQVCKKMGENARQIYKTHYTPDQNYEILMSIYRSVMDSYEENHSGHAS